MSRAPSGREAERVTERQRVGGSESLIVRKGDTDSDERGREPMIAR